MKTYEAIYEPSKNKGVYGISLVENPAMEGNFIALSEQKVEFKTVDEEKRILIGLVLEPNKPIYRNQNGEEFNIVFSEQTIEELAHGFYKGGFQSNSSLEHSNKIEGVTFVESWIVLNEKNDKSNELGLNYPKGSWLATMKVDSDEVWNDFVKSGKVKGFSIDALVSLKEVNFKSELNMSNQILEMLKDLPTKIALALNPKEETPLELGSVKSKEGDVEFMFDGDTMQVDGKVWLVAEDGTEVPVPVGAYELDDNTILVVEVEGVIKEVKAVEEQPAEEPQPQQPAEMTAEQVTETATAIENAIKSIMIKYESQITELKAELKETNDKLVELSEQPATKPVRGTVAQIDLSKMTSKERIFNKINQNK